jgi:hypothetical protein
MASVRRIPQSRAKILAGAGLFNWQPSQGIEVGSRGWESSLDNRLIRFCCITPCEIPPDGVVPVEFARGWVSPHKPVIDPEQPGRGHAYPGHRPPDTCRLMQDFSEVMNQEPAKPSTHERSNADGQEGKAHIGSLLP